VTLRQLREHWSVDARDVFVCENPALVAEAADRFGQSCPALVCVEGMPTTAAHALLERFTQARIRYHGDFDWGGIRAANSVAARVAMTPWRFAAVDYEEAVSNACVMVELRGVAVEASWDPELSPRMA